MNIPRQDISQFMAQLADEKTPSNDWWWYYDSFRNGGVMFYLFAGFGAATIVGMLGTAYTSLQPYWQILGAITLSMLLAAMISPAFNREPGHWRRYSLFQCYLRHQKLGIEAYKRMRELRGGTAADYEIAVLEQHNHGYGAVLFQVVSGSGSIIPDNGLPVAAFDAAGKTIEFSQSASTMVALA